MEQQKEVDLLEEGIDWKGKDFPDLSKCVLYPVSAKPKGWSWGKLVEVAKATGILVYATGQNGGSPSPTFSYSSGYIPADLKNKPEGMTLADYIKSIKDKEV